MEVIIEAWGEDKILTSQMGVAYASGLSKNGSWSEPDAVVPVLKVSLINQASLHAEFGERKKKNLLIDAFV